MPQSVHTEETAHATSRARTLHLVVNGRAIATYVEPCVTLLDFLRDRLGLTGTKKGCNEGACGTCTILVDGRPAATLSIATDGVRILAVHRVLNPDKLRRFPEPAANAGEEAG